MVQNDLPTQRLKAYIGHGANMDTYGVYAKEVQGEAEQSKKILDITFKKHLKSKSVP